MKIQKLVFLLVGLFLAACGAQQPERKCVVGCYESEPYAGACHLKVLIYRDGTWRQPQDGEVLTITADYFGAYGREYWVQDAQGIGLLPPVWCQEIGEPPQAELRLQGDVAVLITQTNASQMDRWTDAGWNVMKTGQASSAACALSFSEDGMASGSCSGQAVRVPLIEAQVVQVYLKDELKVYDGEILVQVSRYTSKPAANQIGGGR